MMLKVHQVIFLYVLLVLSICNASNYMKCDIHDFFPCPTNASCTEQADGSAECRCLDGFKLNENHKNDDDYCLLAATTSSLTSSSNKDVHSINEGDKASASSESHGANSSHLLGGILIPVLVILLIVGVIFVIKRTNLINRVRERIFTRRNRPLYEDVMMSNDNDDPPLI